MAQKTLLCSEGFELRRFGDDLRLRLLWFGGLPWSLLSTFDLVFDSMTQPTVVAWINS